MRSLQTATKRLVLVRHGESVFNFENRFTGWTDVDLTPNGVQEARQAGRDMKEKGYKFDVGYTSCLKRAIKTYNHIADEMDLNWMPIHKMWRLNERHYGALQGFNKQEIADQYGEEQAVQWRRVFDNPPPQLDMEDPRHPRFEPKYRDIHRDLLPRSESLKMTIERVMPVWHDQIYLDMVKGKRVVVVGHMNTLRAMVKILTGMDQSEISDFNLPTATPLVYEFDDNMKLTNHFFDIDPDVLQQRLDAVAAQRHKRMSN